MPRTWTQPLVAVTLLALLIAGGVLAWGAGTRTPTGPAPAYAAPAVPDAGAGSATVVLSADARAHPAGEVVRAQLQRHYDAINARDHAAWTGTVVPARAEPGAAWRAAYATTVDGSVRVDRIDDLPQRRLLVRVRFVSVQDPSAAPPDLPVRRICWRTSLPMSGSPPLIEVSPSGSSAREAC